MTPVLSPTRDVLTTLLAQHVHDSWSLGHTLLHRMGLNRFSRARDAAAACRLFAQTWPADADAWLAEAQTWDAIAGAETDDEYAHE